VTVEAVTLQGKHKEEKKARRKGYYYSHRRHGSFFRSIPMPEGVDPTKATADFHSGLFEVAMPALKRPEMKGRTLEIMGE